MNDLIVFAEAGQETGAGIPVMMVLVYLAVGAAWIAGWWGILTKAGKPGWAAIVPVYNFIVLLEITGKPLWWVIMLFIPCISFIFYVLLGVEVAKVFGKSGGFTVGVILLPFVFWPLLGFGDAKYMGPSRS